MTTIEGRIFLFSGPLQVIGTYSSLRLDFMGRTLVRRRIGSCRLIMMGMVRRTLLFTGPRRVFGIYRIVVAVLFHITCSVLPRTYRHRLIMMVTVRRIYRCSGPRAESGTGRTARADHSLLFSSVL